MKLSGNILVGGVLITAGGAFLLDNIGVIDLGTLFRDFWPVLLIVVGIGLIWRNRHVQDESRFSEWFGDMSREAAAEKIEYSTVFGDCKVSLSSRSFKGGSVSTVFGDTSVNLNSATVAEGEYVLRLTGVFGDVSVVVPSGMAVQLSLSSLLGTLQWVSRKEEGFGASLKSETVDYAKQQRRLRIDASQLLGDLIVSTSTN